MNHHELELALLLQGVKLVENLRTDQTIVAEDTDGLSRHIWLLEDSQVEMRRPSVVEELLGRLLLSR